MNKEITITISGPDGSGKSTLAKLFQEWLVYNNFQVENSDNSNLAEDNEEFFLERISIISKNTKIKIQSHKEYKHFNIQTAGSGGSGIAPVITLSGSSYFRDNNWSGVYYTGDVLTTTATINIG